MEYIDRLKQGMLEEHQLFRDITRYCIETVKHDLRNSFGKTRKKDHCCYQIK